MIYRIWLNNYSGVLLIVSSAVLSSVSLPFYPDFSLRQGGKGPGPSELETYLAKIPCSILLNKGMAQLIAFHFASLAFEELNKAILFLGQKMKNKEFTCPSIPHRFSIILPYILIQWTILLTLERKDKTYVQYTISNIQALYKI